jgi:hypothetical protein
MCGLFPAFQARRPPCDDPLAEDGGLANGHGLALQYARPANFATRGSYHPCLSSREYGTKYDEILVDLP